jgi:hypothetical protein
MDIENKSIDGGGSGSGEANVVTILQDSHGLAIKDVIRLSGSNYIKALADSSTNAEVIGVVSKINSANSFDLTLYGKISDLSSLVAGTVYYLSSSTAGLLTDTEPSVAGQVSKPVLIADSTTSGYVVNMRGIVI